MEIVPTYNLDSFEQLEVPFRLVEMTRRKEGTYDYSAPHRHSYYEAFWFEEGGGEHDIDFTTYPILGGSLHLVAPGQVHLVRRSGNSHGFVLLFGNDLLALTATSGRLLRELPFVADGFQPTVTLDENEAADLRAMIGRLRAESCHRSTYGDEMIGALLNLFLLTVLRLFDARRSPLPNPGDTGLIQGLRALIETNFRTVHSVSAYANLLNVSPHHLNSTVKGALGKTVSGLIQERIVLEAKRLLVHSKLSVKEIAYALGFDDPSYFTRFFRERAGQSPSSFRERD